MRTIGRNYGGGKMFVNQRFKLIADYLKEKKKATVEELAALLYVSPATIRRDLLEMQKMGVIARTHGGALYIENSAEISIFVRLEKNAREKEQAASVALGHLPPFQTVFIDNSSTCLALAERMDLTHKTVVTNGLQVALKLSQKEDVHLIMAAGEVHFNTNSVTGSLTCNLLRSFNLDLMLCSCAALDEKGTYEHSLETIQLKQVALEQTRTHILVADGTKLFRSAPYRTGPLGSYDAVMTEADDETVQPLRDMGLTVYNKIAPQNLL